MVSEWHDGQPIEGWITLTIADGEPVVYGPFESKEKAEKWQSQLIAGTSIKPLYTPFVYNRG